jgi:hypothetical protein
MRTLKVLGIAIVLMCLVGAGGLLLASSLERTAAAADPLSSAPRPHAPGDYIVLTWNDLGMHCYNKSFTDLGVLPPFNNLYAQVVRVGDPPQIITSGITVTYVFTDNTYSVGKSNFWDTSPYRSMQNAQYLFNLANPLPPNVGLAGNGLSGNMAQSGDHFVAAGIPLTEFRDSAPTTPYPYELATVVVYGPGNVELARNIVVAPVSTEMHCDTCHYDNGPGNEGVATGVVEQNILTAHDNDNGTNLMGTRPVLCARCHQSNALPGYGSPTYPNFSNAMHGLHAETGLFPPTIDGCYKCHPGPVTRCLRDIMSQRGTTCINCHGDLQQVSQNPNPWLNEPRCDSTACHGSGFAQDQALYRFSKEHGGIRCEACHDSTHAIAPSREPNDGIKFIALQGHTGTLDTCTVCHATWPTGPGPHGRPAPVRPSFLFGPDQSSSHNPGEQAVYVHSLHNTGNLSDTYVLAWGSVLGWPAAVSGSAGGTPFPVPGNVTLAPDESAVVTVTVTVPATVTLGLTEVTVVTATSTVSPTLVETVRDQTAAPVAMFSFAPNEHKVANPGDAAVFQHELHNLGALTDSYTLTWGSALGWPAAAFGETGGITFTVPGTVTLPAGATATITVTVAVPTGTHGQTEVTVITATSTADPALAHHVIDTTSVLPAVGGYWIYLPIVYRP